MEWLAMTVESAPGQTKIDNSELQGKILLELRQFFKELLKCACWP